jgi:hypothetical protein
MDVDGYAHVVGAESEMRIHGGSQHTRGQCVRSSTSRCSAGRRRAVNCAAASVRRPVVRHIRIGYRCKARRQAIADCVVHDHILIEILQALDKRASSRPNNRRAEKTCPDYVRLPV